MVKDIDRIRQGVDKVTNCQVHNKHLQNSTKSEITVRYNLIVAPWELPDFRPPLNDEEKSLLGRKPQDDP